MTGFEEGDREPCGSELCHPGDSLLRLPRHRQRVEHQRLAGVELTQRRDSSRQVVTGSERNQIEIGRDLLAVESAEGLGISLERAGDEARVRRRAGDGDRCALDQKGVIADIDCTSVGQPHGLDEETLPATSNQRGEFLEFGLQVVKIVRDRLWGPEDDSQPRLRTGTAHVVDGINIRGAVEGHGPCQEESVVVVELRLLRQPVEGDRWIGTSNTRTDRTREIGPKCAARSHHLGDADQSDNDNLLEQQSSSLHAGSYRTALDSNGCTHLGDDRGHNNWKTTITTADEGVYSHNTLSGRTPCIQ